MDSFVQTTKYLPIQLNRSVSFFYLICLFTTPAYLYLHILPYYFSLKLFLTTYSWGPKIEAS